MGIEGKSEVVNWEKLGSLIWNRYFESTTPSEYMMRIHALDGSSRNYCELLDIVQITFNNNGKRLSCFRSLEWSEKDFKLLMDKIKKLTETRGLDNDHYFVSYFGASPSTPKIGTLFVPSPQKFKYIDIYFDQRKPIEPKKENREENMIVDGEISSIKKLTEVSDDIIEGNDKVYNSIFNCLNKFSDMKSNLLDKLTKYDEAHLNDDKRRTKHQTPFEHRKYSIRQQI